MNNQSPKAVKINAEKRNKVYSLLNDIDADTDLVLFDVDKHVHYKAAQLDKERNIYVYLKNYYNRRVCITSIQLEDSAGEQKEIPFILVQNGDSLETRYLNETVKSTDNPQASEQVKDKKGCEVDAKAQMYFYIPYTYRDFLGKNAGDPKEYNKIVIDGVGWNWKSKKQEDSDVKIDPKEEKFHREIKIEEQGLFLLE